TDRLLGVVDGDRLGVGVGEHRDLPELGDAAALDHVRLQDVDPAGGDQVTELPDAVLLFADRDRDVDGVGEAGVRLVVVRGERLLEVPHTELLQGTGDPDRGVRVVGVVDVHHD